MLIGVVAAACALAARLADAFSPLEAFYQDAWHQVAGKRGDFRHTALVVVVDGITIEQLKEDPLAFWQPQLAKVMDRLAALGAKALALTPGAASAGEEDDGLLTMSEVRQLKLNANWVVLSACNTGSGDGASSEAVSGLGRAFFFAGTRAVLVSNWPMEASSARALAAGIFSTQAASQASPACSSRARALRAAQSELIANGSAKGADGQALYSYADPLFWALFSLVGDGGS